MATSFEYSTQALTYDTTRAASPSVLGPLRQALGAPVGDGSLLDVGGGTGNYAAALRDHGWRPVVVDRNAGMLGAAAAKGLAVARADAASLPTAAGSVDAVMLVSMLHHVPDWRVALAEARRVVRPGGVVAVMAYAREHLLAHGIEDYFPETRDHVAVGHQPRRDLLAVLPGAEELPVRYDDLVDGSLAALGRRPELVLDPELRRQTSFIELAERERPEELARGLARLASDLEAGIRPQDRGAALREEIGDALVLAWRAPT